MRRTIFRIAIPAFLAVLTSRCLAAEEGAAPPPVAPPPAASENQTEFEYHYELEAGILWQITGRIPYESNAASVRLEINPPIGLPGALSRLAVYRGPRLLGFVRVSQSYGPGCIVGRLRTSLDPTDIQAGDTLRQFKITKRPKSAPATITSRDKRKITAAVSDLGDRSFKVREEASAFLKGLGIEVLPFLHDALKSPDPEISTRAKEIADLASEKDRTVEPKLADLLMRVPGVFKPLDKQGFLGVSMNDAANTSKTGVLVDGIVKGAPAEKLQLRRGDLILSVDGEEIFESTDLVELISSKDPGTKVKLKIRRGEEGLDVEATLGGRPERPIMR